jgi:hypothetical protein
MALGELSIPPQSGASGTPTAVTLLRETISASTTFAVLSAPFGLTITGVRLITSAGMAASDVSYWTVNLRKYDGATFTTFGTKTTQVTGGAEMVANVGWAFDAGAFTAAAALATGESLVVQCVKTGTPPNLANAFVTFTYEAA